MDDTLADLSVLNPVHHTHRVTSAILMLSHDQLVLEQVTYQLPVPPKGSHPPGQHPDGIHHGQPLVDVLLVDVLALAGTMVHNHHDVPQLVYLHALLHVRLPRQHLLLHCGSKGKSTMLVLKLGHKFNFLEDLVPNKSDMSMEVTTAITTVQPHTILFHRTWVKLGHIHRVKMLSVGMLPSTAALLATQSSDIMVGRLHTTYKYWKIQENLCNQLHNHLS